MLNLSYKRIDKKLLERHELRSLNTLSTPKSAKILSRWIISILILLFVALFLPWQQNITGKGYVSAFRPQDRPQDIENIISGRIETWKVAEGQFVKKGDTLLVVSEVKDDYFDPQINQRLAEQITAKENSIGAYKTKITALNQQSEALQEGLRLSLQKAKNKLRQAQFKVIADSTDWIAVNKNYQIAQDRLDRFEKGNRQGLFSLTDLETRRLKVQEDYAKVISQENKLAISRNEAINARIELASVAAEYQKDIAKAISEKSSAMASLAEGDAELSKLRNKLSNVEVRQGNYIIKSPQDGYVVKAMKTGIGEMIKEGESICTLQPAKPEKIVELYVKAMDVPLIQKNKEVRLQFDGWPALVFSGWQNTSIGTFGGKVEVIDMVNSKNGDYRLLVSSQEPWPQQLRIGSGVYGWVMLESVPIWYEIWRQLNGFPPNWNEDQNQKTKEEKK